MVQWLATVQDCSVQRRDDPCRIANKDASYLSLPALDRGYFLMYFSLVSAHSRDGRMQKKHENIYESIEYGRCKDFGTKRFAGTVGEIFSQGEGVCLELAHTYIYFGFTHDSRDRLKHIPPR